MFEIKKSLIFSLVCLLAFSGATNGALAAPMSVIKLGETGSYQEAGVVATSDGSVLSVEVSTPGISWSRAYVLPRKALYSNLYEASLEIISLDGVWAGLGFGKPEMGIQILVSKNGRISLRTWQDKQYREIAGSHASFPLDFPGRLELVYNTERAEVLASWNGKTLFSSGLEGRTAVPSFILFERVEVVTFSPRRVSGSASYGDLKIDLR